MDRNHPYWKPAADLARRLTTCEDIEKRTEIYTAARDVWKVGMFLARDVATSCPRVFRDYGGRATLNHLAPPKYSSPLVRASVAIADGRVPALRPAGKVVAVTARIVAGDLSGRLFLAKVFAVMADIPDAEVRDPALVVNFYGIRKDPTLNISVVTLCLEALDTIRAVK